jgi:hypothetical protein
MTRAAIDRVRMLIGPLAACAALALPASSPAVTPSTPPPKPPLAYAAYVEQVTASSAVLKGRVNPRGLATEYYFQYGPTTAYGSQSSAASAGSGTLEVKLTQPVTGLQPYTTYHFRVIATSSAGTTASTDATFVTKKIPLSLAASATPTQIVFGSALSVSGTLSGTGNASVGILLQANLFPYNHGFQDITAPVPTDALGSFSIPIPHLLQSARLRAATVGTPTAPTIYSPATTELVSVHVTLHVRPAARRGFVRLYGTVTPPKAGARVAFEQRDHGRYVLISGTLIRARPGGGSRFARTLRLGPGIYRALVQIKGGPQVSGRSLPVVIR